MNLDIDALKEIVRKRGRTVCRVSTEGGAPGYTGSAGVVRFAGLYWAYDDDGGLGGPHHTLWDALGEEHLSFGEVDITVTVEGTNTARYAAAMCVEAPAGHTVEINGEQWVLGEDGFLSPAEPPPKKRKATPRRRKKSDGEKG